MAIIKLDNPEKGSSDGLLISLQASMMPSNALESQLDRRFQKNMTSKHKSCQKIFFFASLHGKQIETRLIINFSMIPSFCDEPLIILVSFSLALKSSVLPSCAPRQHVAKYM